MSESQVVYSESGTLRAKSRKLIGDCFRLIANANRVIAKSSQIQSKAVLRHQGLTMDTPPNRELTEAYDSIKTLKTHLGELENQLLELRDVGSQGVR